MSRFPLYAFGGEGTVIHLAVANGFPPAVYEPLLRPVTADFRVLSLPPRPLWPGEQPPDQLHDWQMTADDLLDGLRNHNLTDVIAIGHSFGGVASMLAVLADPARFRALCLLDPTILPPPALDYMAQMQAEGNIGEFPLVQGALRRRAQFESAEAAYAYFKTRPLFQNWPDETVRLYAESGTRPTTNGGVELAWSPAWEAYIFSTLYTRTWDVLSRLSLPLLVIRGGESDTFIPEAAAQIQHLLPDTTYAEIAGHGHLFPMSAADTTAPIIQKWLAKPD